MPWPAAVVSGNGGREAGKYCCLCGAWFNNPLMAQQHYEGKKHRRNAARARLLEQLAGSLDATESTGQPRHWGHQRAARKEKIHHRSQVWAHTHTHFCIGLHYNQVYKYGNILVINGNNKFPMS